MPKIENLQVIDISPEKFLRACSEIELTEIWLLLQTKEFGSKIIVNDDVIGNDYMKNIQEICTEVREK